MYIIVDNNIIPYHKYNIISTIYYYKCNKLITRKQIYMQMHILCIIIRYLTLDDNFPIVSFLSIKVKLILFCIFQPFYIFLHYILYIFVILEWIIFLLINNFYGMRWIYRFYNNVRFLFFYFCVCYHRLGQ